MYTVVGNEIMKDGAAIDRAGSHTEAIKLAQDRAGGARSTSIEPTAYAEIALNWVGAEAYRTVVDVEAAVAEDLAATSDPAEIRAILGRKPEEVRQARERRVEAKRVSDPFRHRGIAYEAGDWIVRHPDGLVEAYTDAAFQAAFRPAKAAKG